MVYTPNAWVDGDIITAAKANRLENAVSQNAAAIDGVSKTTVGLANVDNTSDAQKPVSGPQQTALNGKADLVGGVVPAAQSRVSSVAGKTGAVTVTSADLTDATNVGRAVFTAADAAAARSAIGAAASGTTATPLAFSFTDTFTGRGTGSIGTNYQQYTRYAASEFLQITNTPDVLRNGAPGAENWNDGAVLLQDTGGLAQRVELTISLLQDSGGWSGGQPPVTAWLRAPGAATVDNAVWTCNNDNSFPGVGLALFCGISTTGWFVWVGAPGTYSAAAAGSNGQRGGWLAKRGAGTYTAGGIFAAQITADDALSLTYKGVTLLAPTKITGVPKHQFTGFTTGAGSGGSGGGNRVTKFAATNTLV